MGFPVILLPKVIHVQRIQQLFSNVVMPPVQSEMNTPGGATQVYVPPTQQQFGQQTPGGGNANTGGGAYGGHNTPNVDPHNSPVTSPVTPGGDGGGSNGGGDGSGNGNGGPYTGGGPYGGGGGGGTDEIPVTEGPAVKTVNKNQTRNVIFGLVGAAIILGILFSGSDKKKGAHAPAA